MLPVFQSHFGKKWMQRGTTSSGRKRKEMKKASHKNRAIELKVKPICAAKWLFLQSFLKIIFIRVLSTAVFWQFLLIPKPYMHNFSCGETVTHNWCPQLVLLHYFAIKVMFKAVYWKHFSIILYGKSEVYRANNFVRGVYQHHNFSPISVVQLPLACCVRNCTFPSWRRRRKRK